MKSLLSFFCLIVIGLAGCGDRITQPEKIQGFKNTFKMPLWFGNVDRVIVYDMECDNSWCLVWEIEPIVKISASSFNVTVPYIPDGFKQVVPPLPKHFELKAGHRYSILIYTDRLSQGNTRDRLWIAE